MLIVRSNIRDNRMGLGVHRWGRSEITLAWKEMVEQLQLWVIKKAMVTSWVGSAGCLAINMLTSLIQKMGLSCMCHVQEGVLDQLQQTSNCEALSVISWSESMMAMTSSNRCLPRWMPFVPTQVAVVDLEFRSPVGAQNFKQKLAAKAKLLSQRHW